MQLKPRLFLLLLFFSANGFAQVNVGTINAQLVLDTLPSRKKALEELDVVEERFLKELKTMDSALYAFEVWYSQHPEIEYVEPPAVSNEDKMKEMSLAILKREGEMDTELQRLYLEVQQKSDEEMRGIIAQIAKREKLDYVIDSRKMLYYEARLDITSLVIKEILKP